MTTLPALNSKVIIRPENDAQQDFAGVVFEVVAHLRTNVTIQALGAGAALLGRRARMRVNPSMLAAAPEGYDANTTATATTVPYYKPLVLATVFTVPAGTLRGVTEKDLMVVIGTNGVAYKAARLGGDRDRYFRNVARAAMREVPLAELGERLAGLTA